MNFEEFKEWAENNVKFFLPESYKDAKIDIYDVVKTGASYTGMTVRNEGQAVAPAVNLDSAYEAYQNGSQLYEVGANMAQIIQAKQPELDTGILVTVGGVVSTVFLFIYFGILERIAEEYDSPRASTIGLLKYFYVALYVAFVVTALLSVDPVRMPLVYLATILGFSALVVSIMTAFVLFKLRNDIRE